ncbi:hypothetical protein CPB86DRAFT_798018 [Serendipita vermifera]|nr:hypothetical protein CPB86DRAFT_798018 [Serendipita vermifera]
MNSLPKFLPGNSACGTTTLYATKTITTTIPTTYTSISSRPPYDYFFGQNITTTVTTAVPRTSTRMFPTATSTIPCHTKRDEEELELLEKQGGASPNIKLSSKMSLVVLGAFVASDRELIREVARLALGSPADAGYQFSRIDESKSTVPDKVKRWLNTYSTNATSRRFGTNRPATWVLLVFLAYRNAIRDAQRVFEWNHEHATHKNKEATIHLRHNASTIYMLLVIYDTDIGRGLYNAVQSRVLLGESPTEKVGNALVWASFCPNYTATVTTLVPSTYTTTTTIKPHAEITVYNTTTCLSYSSTQCVSSITYLATRIWDVFYTQTSTLTVTTAVPKTTIAPVPTATSTLPCVSKRDGEDMELLEKRGAAGPSLKMSSKMGVAILGALAASACLM